MPQPTGDYWIPYTWLQLATTQDTTYGEQQESWVEIGTLWGSLLEEGGIELQTFGATMGQATGTIRVRQLPNIKATDRLIDQQYDNTYLIDGVYIGKRWDNELILAVHRFENNEV